MSDELVSNFERWELIDKLEKTEARISELEQRLKAAYDQQPEDATETTHRDILIMRDALAKSLAQILQWKCEPPEGER